MTKSIQFTFLIQLVVTVIGANDWVSLPKRNWSSPTRGRKGIKSTCQSRHLSETQQKLCRRKRNHMEHVNHASEVGVKECQRQFRNLQWNCTSFKRRNTDTVFGKMAKLGTRETAYINAITSAALVQSIAKACRQSLEDCGCGTKRNPTAELLPKPSYLDPSTEWNACGEDINYGVQFAREFVDVQEQLMLVHAKKCLAALNDQNASGKGRVGDQCKLFSRPNKSPSKEKIRAKMAKIKMNLHNNEAGREVAKKSRRLSCKCHGVSGSCASKTCWYEIPQMSVIGKQLKDKYDDAQRITYVHKRSNGAEYVTIQPKRPDRSHGSTSLKDKLLFLSKSPDFCTKNLPKDIIGTTGRECNISSTGDDSCDELCCGRGVIKQIKTVVEDCDCHFEWCCEVKCNKCTREVQIHTCK